MTFTEDGIVSAVNPVLRNTWPEIRVREFESVNEVNSGLLPKADTLIVVTVLGIDTCLRPLAKKAISSINVTLSGMTTEIKFLVP